MNLFEHFEAVEHASLLTKPQILDADWCMTRDLNDSLEHDALVSFHVIQRFREQMEAAGNELP